MKNGRNRKSQCDTTNLFRAHTCACRVRPLFHSQGLWSIHFYSLKAETSATSSFHSTNFLLGALRKSRLAGGWLGGCAPHTSIAWGIISDSSFICACENGKSICVCVPQPTIWNVIFSTQFSLKLKAFDVKYNTLSVSAQRGFLYPHKYLARHYLH